MLGGLFKKTKCPICHKEIGALSKSIYKYKAACKNAQEVLSMLNVITNQQAENNDRGDTISSADEIKKYKELLDSGTITKEEYEAKKKQLLEL